MKNKLPTALIVVLALGGLLVLAVPALGIVAAIAIPNFVAMQVRAKRAEVPTTVESIGTAVLAYEAAFGALPGAVGSPAQPPGREQRPWEGGPDWERIGWAPPTDLRGVYWVEPTPDGFAVYGRCDVDGDREAAEYRWTRDGGVQQITPKDVY